MAVTEREQKVQTKIINTVRKYGGYVYKNSQNMYTEKGRPDLTACIPTKINTLLEILGPDATVGLFVGIEVKRDGHLGELSEAQKIVGNKIKKSAGIWLAIDNPDVIEALMLKFTSEVE